MGKENKSHRMGVGQVDTLDSWTPPLETTPRGAPGRATSQRWGSRTKEAGGGLQWEERGAEWNRHFIQQPFTGSLCIRLLPGK